MKKILLIGDSIRMGYDSYVAESLQDIAKVYYPQENCMYSTNVLRKLHAWADALKAYDVDAVHFNVGHWDTVRIYGDEPLTDMDTYAKNLARIVERIRFLFPSAKIVFATSTPVDETGFIQDFETRYNADVEKYNAVACEVMRKYGVIINDLYGLMKDKPLSYHSDQTHFYTAQATELLGKRVVQTLCEALGIDCNAITYPDSQKYHRPNKGIPDKEAFEKKGRIYVAK